MVKHPLGGLNLGCHISKRELNSLVLADWFSKLNPRLGILNSIFESRHGGPQMDG